MKCIVCGDEVQVLEKEGREYYECANGHERSRMIKNNGLSYYEKDGQIIHESVGAILKRKGKVLLLKRRKYPYKYTIPAGHLEEGENKTDAVLREIKEETGLEVGDVEEIFEGELKDKCRRGADRHYWNLFESVIPEGEDILLNDEASEYKLVEREDLGTLDLTRPTRTLLVEKGI